MLQVLHIILKQRMFTLCVGIVEEILSALPFKCLIPNSCLQSLAVVPVSVWMKN